MATAAKIDIYRQFRSEYITPKKPSLVNVQPARYLTFTGRGEPGGVAFQSAIGALYNVAFTVKMARKFTGQDYTVCKLEGLWWADDPTQCFASQPRETWNWKLMIRVPSFVDEGDLKAAVEKLHAKRNQHDISDVKLEVLDEGACLQILHVGPYDQEVRNDGPAASLRRTEQDGVPRPAPRNLFERPAPRSSRKVENDQIGRASCRERV